MTPRNGGRQEGKGARVVESRGPRAPRLRYDIFRSAKLRLASQKMISVRAGGAESPKGPDGEIYFACRSPHPLNDGGGRTKAVSVASRTEAQLRTAGSRRRRRSPQRVLMQAFAWQACRPGDRLGLAPTARAKTPGRTPSTSQTAGRSQASEPDWSNTASKAEASAWLASRAARVSNSERRR